MYAVEWKAYGCEVKWRAGGSVHEATIIPVDVETRRYWCCECLSGECEHVQAAVHDIIDRESR